MRASRADFMPEGIAPLLSALCAVARWSPVCRARRRLSANVVCARLGSVAATYALEHMGGLSHAYTWDEFKARYQQHFGVLTLRA